MVKIQLLIELNNYTDIFNKEFTNELPPNHPGDYIIKIDGKDPLYRLLYSFSARKLEVFHQYLDKILEKKWIKLFTSLVRAPILFILKKDKIL